jgi:hypothetical protein
MDTADHRVTHVVLDDGHLLAHGTNVDPDQRRERHQGDADGVRLNLTKEQVGDLPPPPAGLNISG